MLRLLIVLLTLTTALVHANFFIEKPSTDVIYALNGLGYVTLLVLLYLPLPALDPFRRPVRWIFMGYTALTILAYLIFGLVTHDWTVPLGPITKAVELILIGLLWVEGQRSNA